MMEAEYSLLIEEAVQSIVDVGFDRTTRFVGGLDLALKAADPLLCDRFVCKGEGLRQDELVVHLQQPIQHAGTSEWRIFFD